MEKEWLEGKEIRIGIVSELIIFCKLLLQKVRAMVLCFKIRVRVVPAVQGLSLSGEFWANLYFCDCFAIIFI